MADGAPVDPSTTTSLRVLRSPDVLHAVADKVVVTAATNTTFDLIALRHLPLVEEVVFENNFELQQSKMISVTSETAWEEAARLRLETPIAIDLLTAILNALVGTRRVAGDELKQLRQVVLDLLDGKGA